MFAQNNSTHDAEAGGTHQPWHEADGGSLEEAYWIVVMGTGGRMIVVMVLFLVDVVVRGEKMRRLMWREETVKVGTSSA